MEEKMAVKQNGKAALQLIKEFRSRKWFGASFIDFATKISKEYSARSEVLYGCLCSSGGTVGTTDYDFSYVAGEIMLGGKTYVLPAGTGANLRTAHDILYSNGTAAHTDNLAGNDGNHVGVIAINSNDAGDITAEGTAPKIIGIINAADSAGCASTTAGPSSATIAAALEAYAQHTAVTGWAYLAVVEFNIGTTNSTVTSNINNHLGL